MCEKSKVNTINEFDELQGLGGWLILVGAGVLFTPFRFVIYSFWPFWQMITDESWGVLTTKGTEFYIPYFATYTIGNIVITIFLFLLSIYIIYLLFSEHYLFPRFYVFILTFSLFHVLLDAWVASLFVPEEPMFDPETLKDFIVGLITVLIWVPYILLSKRVKLTFINKKPT